MKTSSRDRKLHCVSINHNDFDLDDSPNNCKCNIAGLYCGSDIFPGNAAGDLETADFNMSNCPVIDVEVATQKHFPWMLLTKTKI